MFKRINMIVIIFLLLFSMLVPSSSSGPIKIPPLINVTYLRPEENIIPLSEALDIPLFTSFELTGPLASIVERYSLLRRSVINIELKIVETEDWCVASITNPLVQLGLDHTEPYQSTLKVTVDENAPAFVQGIVKISATLKELRGLVFSIAEETFEFEVSFIIGYLPIVSYKMPKGTIAEIGPFDTADFQIDIENYGNGPTYVIIEIIEIPEGDWSVNISSDVQLSSAVNGGEGTKKTVHLLVKPPFLFGLHNEIEIFKVKFTPHYLGRADLMGQEEIIQFNVKKISILKEEEELDNNLLIILGAAVVLIIFISIFLKRRHLN